MNLVKKNMFLILMIIVIGSAPLFFINNSDFGGADGRAEDAITEIAPNYKPWAESPIELPGGETESLLFALQAAIGAGVVGYILGYFKGKNSNDNR